MKFMSITISCISITKAAFGLQKLHFDYKYLLAYLQRCISLYKTASRSTTKHISILLSSLIANRNATLPTLIKL